MVERRDGVGLPVEAREAVGVVGGRVGQHLQGDLAAEPVVARAVDLSHAALAERRQDLVGAELLSGGSAMTRRIHGVRIVAA